MVTEGTQASEEDTATAVMLMAGKRACDVVGQEGRKEHGNYGDIRGDNGNVTGRRIVHPLINTTTAIAATRVRGQCVMVRLKARDNMLCCQGNMGSSADLSSPDRAALGPGIMVKVGQAKGG